MKDKCEKRFLKKDNFLGKGRNTNKSIIIGSLLDRCEFCLIFFFLFYVSNLTEGSLKRRVRSDWENTIGPGYEESCTSSGSHLRVCVFFGRGDKSLKGF